MAASQDPGNSARDKASAALAVIVMGMVVQGVAKTPRFAFSTSYIDANVTDKNRTGFYMGKT
jgi:hypothetical protein